LLITRYSHSALRARTRSPRAGLMQIPQRTGTRQRFCEAKRDSRTAPNSVWPEPVLWTGRADLWFGAPMLSRGFLGTGFGALGLIACTSPRQYAALEPTKDAAVASTNAVATSGTAATTASTTAGTASTALSSASMPDATIVPEDAGVGDAVADADASEPQAPDSSPAVVLEDAEAGSDADAAPPASTVSATALASASSAPNPAGYHVSGAWAGCAWTSTEAAGQTTVTPADFTQQVATAPYCIDGSVAGLNYEGFVVLGFNLNESPPETCEAAAPHSEEPAQPSVSATGDGLAIDLQKRDTSFPLRVELIGPIGHQATVAGYADRWCTLIEGTGKIFVPFTAFATECWVTSGQAYNGEPLSAVAFTVPGKDVDDTPYDFCVNGWAYGSSAADAPSNAEDQVGTLVDSAAANDSPRAKVVVAGEEYAVQTNVLLTGASLVLSYTNNGFVVDSASGTGVGSPVSLPSISVGSGLAGGGQASTRATDNLPKAISAIESADTTFRWSGNSGVFDANITLWFADADPMGQRYNDGLDAIVMIWLNKPASVNPYGAQVGTIMVSGQTFNVWQGPRGASPTEAGDLVPDPNAPVISFVATSTLNSVTFDLNDFIDVSVGQYGLPASLLLTDVLAGFEIWSGGAGLTVDEFTIDIQ
jgi:Glycosyl hydrolase family 12